MRSLFVVLLLGLVVRHGHGEGGDTSLNDFSDLGYDDLISVSQLYDKFIEYKTTDSQQIGGLLETVAKIQATVNNLSASILNSATEAETRHADEMETLGAMETRLHQLDTKIDTRFQEIETQVMQTNTATDALGVKVDALDGSLNEKLLRERNALLKIIEQKNGQMKTAIASNIAKSKQELQDGSTSTRLLLTSLLNDTATAKAAIDDVTATVKDELTSSRRDFSADLRALSKRVQLAAQRANDSFGGLARQHTVETASLLVGVQADAAAHATALTESMDEQAQHVARTLARSLHQAAQQS
ncbi:PREDICTED: uncharacterized protein LOC106806245, partial [Priapulus caudatus]|uniref:Uncharacterized protein LOC106806245 n=1 Tax=Priapulus caudatus TaxID=37621 RepID=A0ABM1DUI4_PRICU